MIKLRKVDSILNLPHCVNIATFFGRLVKPTSDLSYNKIQV